MDEKGLRVNYDPQTDVAYFSYGEPREALSVEGDEGVIFRLDPETNAVVGVTVINFLQRFQKNPGDFISLSSGHEFSSQAGL